MRRSGGGMGEGVGMDVEDSTGEATAPRLSEECGYVLAFASTHAAMAASKALEAADLRVSTIPTPAAISAGCGIALKFTACDPDPYLSCVREAVRADGAVTLHRRADDGGYRLAAEL